MMKLQRLLKALALLVCLVSLQTASAFSFNKDGIYYNILSSTDKTVEVTYRNTSYNSYSGSVIIPSTVTYNNTTYTVTAIGKDAFFNSSTLINVSIPNTVTMIKSYAFSSTALSRVIIPNSVAIIDEGAFCNCNYLTDIIIGSGVTYIADYAFGFGEYDDPQFVFPTQKVLCTASTPPIFGFRYGEEPEESNYYDEMWEAFWTLRRLYVPNNSLSRYNSADGWRLFREITPLGQYYGNAAHIGGYETSIDFWTGGDYPWIVDRTDGVLHVQSGNAGCANSTSELNASVTIPGNATLSFDFKAWGEGTSYDKCIFLIDGEVQFSYGARDNDWETYFVNLSRGTHTLTWKYTKDGSVNPTGDYFALDNVTLAALSLAYACYTSTNQTLTFYNDNERDNRTGKIYSLNTGDNTPGWVLDDNNESITRVVFDSLFASARPTTTCYWFYMENLESISGFEYLNTSAVTNMNEMFYGCGLTNLDLSSFNTSKVTTMRGMFEFSYFSSLDLSSFNTANVTNMSDMFSFSAVGSVDMSNFNTSKVTDMGSMFESCGMLTSLNLASFNTVKVTDMERMFRDCNELTTIYVGRGWTTAAVTSSNEMFKNCTSIRGQQGTTYSSSHVDKGYAHIDGGTSNPGYLTAATEAYACYTSSNTTLTFYYDNQRANRSGTTYDLNSGLNVPGWNDQSGMVTRVVIDAAFADVQPTTTYSWFANMNNLLTINGLENLNTSRVTSMQSMFYNCKKLTSLDLRNFNTINVTNMSFMFWGCEGLTSLDLSHFNTSSVTNMTSMFYYCTGLLRLDLSSFNTAKVTDMSRMFCPCTGLTTLDLTSFKTTRVTDMEKMFYGCANLTTISVGLNWNTEAVTNSDDMFNGCSRIVGSMGTTYDANHVDKEYAHVDGGTDNPGYLSAPVEPYACYTSANTTLTFYCDNQRSLRTGTTWNMNSGNAVRPGWTGSIVANVTQVVFDPSFANARPVTTYCWFWNMSNLQSISGLEYLNTSDVTNMANMFLSCSQLTSLDLSTFNTANVTSMEKMFYGCTGLTSLDVSNFNTTNVTDMEDMFWKCNSLTSLDVSSFNTANVTTMGSMFQYCSNLTSLDVSHFNTAKVRVMWDMFSECSSLTSLDLTSFNTANVTQMGSMFLNDSNLVTIYVDSGWNTDSVHTSNFMFLNCLNIRGGKGTTYDADHITKEYAHIDGGPSDPGYFSELINEGYACYTPSDSTLTFYYDYLRSTRTGTTYDLNDGSNRPVWANDIDRTTVTKVVFDPSFADARPTSTRSWFYCFEYLSSITGIEYLNTSEVTDMAAMFIECAALTSLDLSGFNTSNVTNIFNMFNGCSHLTSLDVSGFNTENVTDMRGMFWNCSRLTSLDLSSFNTAGVGHMANMFRGCSNLTTISVGDGWNVDAVNFSSDMFSGCTSLVGGKGTTYDANHVDKAYAHIDGGPSDPGYMSSKGERGDVSGDGYIDITDVTLLINAVLTGDLTNINASSADCDGNGEIDITDVTMLIARVLTGAW